MPMSNKRPLAVTRSHVIRKISTYIEFMQAVVLNITDHPIIFVTPSPALAGVTTRLNALETAQTLAQTRVQGSAAARDVAYNTSLDDMLGLKAYVQTLADNSISEDVAISVIEASGFGLKNHGVRVKPPLAATQFNDSSVKLVAKSAGSKATYEWRQSINGTDWTLLPVTLIAKAIVSGLNPGTRYYFQVRSLTRDGFSPWSSFVTIILQ